MRGSHLHHHLAGATFIGDGRTTGTLVSFGRYPGLLEGDGEVKGEIYRLGTDAAAALEALDEVEGFDPADPERSEYVRELRDVRPQEGAAMVAWVYLYNADASHAPVVRDGDWRNEAARARART